MRKLNPEQRNIAEQEADDLEWIECELASLPEEQRAEREEFWRVIREPHLRLNDVLRRLGFDGRRRLHDLRRAMRDSGFTVDQAAGLGPFAMLGVLEARANALEQIDARGQRASPRLRELSGAEGGRPEGLPIDVTALETLRLRGNWSRAALARHIGVPLKTLLKIYERRRGTLATSSSR
jgi:hypothetical protein